MTQPSFKTTATKGIFWSAIDKFAGQAIGFVIGIILARLLIPKDYGLIGMLSIFFAISQSFINSGMTSALIQKTNRSNVDFSTVFIFSLAVSVLFYGLLFVAAPVISSFYNMPQLLLLTRILGLNIVINSLAGVQKTILTINIDFKTIAKINLIAGVIGGIIGILFALKGWGVWSLVIQTLSGSALSTIILWYTSRWKPSWQFSKLSFQELFGFGSKLLFASLYAETFNNIYNITIGKVYSAVELGFYNRAKGYAELSAETVSSILKQATYPLLATLQDDPQRMASIYSRLIKMAAFTIFPIMTLISLLADPFIRLALGEKWVPAIVLLQWVSFARIFYPISVLNLNLLVAKGRSDLFLKVDLSKLPITIIALVITIPLGVKAMVIGHIVTSCISFFINAYIPGKMCGYGALAQLKDMIPIFIATIIMSILVFATLSLIQSLLLKLTIGSIIGIISYGVVTYLLKVEAIQEIKSLALMLRK